MHIFFEAIDAAKSTSGVWVPIVVQLIATAGLIFGGAEYWKFRQRKLDKEDKASGTQKLISDTLDEVKSLNTKVDTMSSDISDLHKDIALLQQANEETIKYRNARDAADQQTSQERQAMIESLKSLMRERLLDVYNKCVKKGFYSKEEREVYKPLYECYTSDPFRGNGVMKDLHHIMVRLPMSPDGDPVDDD
jgi:chromosome segregation ATPase